MTHLRNHLGFGCVALTTHSSLNNALKILETAYCEGITYFDTAPLYGTGYSEKILGRFLKNKRERITIATKFGLSSWSKMKIPVAAALPLNRLKKITRPVKNTSAEFKLPVLSAARIIDVAEIRRSFENSCKNLRTEYIDYYLLHEALPFFLTDEALLYVMSLKDQRLVKKIGIAASYVNLNNLPDISGWDVLQYEFGPLYNSGDLVNRFPAAEHIYHSIFKKINHDNSPETGQTRGAALGKAILNNPRGKVLFSTSQRDRIKHNIKSMEEYAEMNREDFNKISDAIY